MRKALLAPFVVLLLEVCLPVRLPAQTIHDVRSDCHDAFVLTTRATIESCALAYLQMPIRPVLKTIVPGSGFGGGFTVKHTFPLVPASNLKAPWRLTPTGTALASYNRFLFLEGSLTLERPQFGCADFTGCTTAEAFKTEFFVRRVEAPRLDFYGIGNSTSQSTHVLYSERWYEGGVDIVDPATSWLDVGGGISYMQPHIGPRTNGSYPSIGTEFSATTAPGLDSQPAFAHYSIYFEPHYPENPPFTLDYVITYAYYSDLDDGRFSFHKFSADLSNTFPLRIRGHFKVNPKKPRPLRDWFCGLPSKANKVCEAGDVTLRGVLTLETAAAGQTVPFYLQPTLGGANLQDIDTLRGFADYRFRAPNALYLQAEYSHTLPWKFQWLKLLTFYDVGQVGVSAGDLGFDQLHQDFGLGIIVSAAGHEIARAYVGFGGGEGQQWNGKFGSPF